MKCNKNQHNISPLWAISPQWWITGFNPNFTEPNPDVMVSLGTIDFTGREDMFNALKFGVLNSDKEYLKDYIIFDEDGHTVWLIWYQGVII